jgi:CubicO group peptidase (beta-lactamase class C family)
MMRRVLNLMMCGTILALLVTACSSPAPAVAPTPPKPDAVRPAGAKTPDGGVPTPATNVNARIERVENGLIELAATGDVLWEHTLTLVERMEHYGVPGVSLAVINDYHVEWVKGYGVREAGSGQAVRPDTLFHAGSIAKTLSAAAALTLVEQGRLDLDQNVNEKLVSWQVPEDAYTQNEKVTLRRLLSHSAGLTDGFTETGIECCYSTEGEAPTVSIQQMLEADPVTGLPRPARVIATPGSQYRYANLGYGIVQLLVGETTQVPIDHGGLATSSGLGFELSGAGETQGIQHGGGTWCSTCFLIAYPQTGQGAVIVTNSRTSGSLLTEILISLSVEYGWPLTQEEDS